LREGYALEDLNFSELKKYRTALAEIQESHLIDYDVGNSVVLIKKYHLTANPVVSPNQIKAIKYIIGALPKTHLVYALKELIREPAVIERGKNEEVFDELEKLAPGEIFQNSAPGNTPGEINQKRSPPRTDKDQAKKDANALGDIWNDICGHVLPMVKEITKNRMKHIQARLRERSLEDWEKIFSKILTSSFLTGHGKDGWSASFDWIISSYDNSVKVLEGKYDDNRNKNGGTGPTGMDALNSFAQRMEERKESNESGQSDYPTESQEGRIDAGEPFDKDLQGRDRDDYDGLSS
jgi:hypothetical protein